MEEINIKDIFIVIRHKKISILVITSIITIIGIIYSLIFVTPVYTSSAILVLSSNNNADGTSDVVSTDITLNSKLVATYEELIKSGKILKKVVGNLQDIQIDETELRTNIAISAISGTDILRISMNSSSPEHAAIIVNEVSKVFIEEINQVYSIDNIILWEEGEVPSTSSNIDTVRNISISIIIGLIVSAIYVFVMHILDTTIKSEKDIENLLGVPVLAVIPILKEEDIRLKGETK